MADLFAHVPDVIGADLRNEPSGAYGHPATWDGAAVDPDCKTRAGADLDTPTNWEEAAQETGSVVLTADPNLLIFVEGPGSSTNLSAVFDGDGGRGLPLPLCLNGVPVHKLVYSPHDYQWDVDSSSFAALSLDLYTHWGKILTPGQSYTAPIWVGEFGGCDTRPLCTTVTQTACPGGLIPACVGNFFEYFTQYLAQNDVDWGYWALNGTRSEGGANVAPNRYARGNLLLLSRWTWFEPSVRGVFSYRWRNDTATGRSGLLPRLQCIQPPTQGPLPPRTGRAAPRRTSPACLPPAVPAPPSPAS
jgi:endoglucanase